MVDLWFGKRAAYVRATVFTVAIVVAANVAMSLADAWLVPIEASAAVKQVQDSAVTYAAACSILRWRGLTSTFVVCASSALVAVVWARALWAAGRKEGAVEK